LQLELKGLPFENKENKSPKALSWPNMWIEVSIQFYGGQDGLSVELNLTEESN
jgi:hypothetical protein